VEVRQAIAWAKTWNVLLVAGVFFTLGLILNLAGKWESPAGDAAWLLGGFALAVYALRQCLRQITPLGRAASAAFVLLGISSATLMGYWIGVDLQWLDRLPGVYTTGVVVSIAVVSGVLGLAAQRTGRWKD
jgi:hypothetical protein